MRTRPWSGQVAHGDLSGAARHHWSEMRLRATVGGRRGTYRFDCEKGNERDASNSTTRESSHPLIPPVTDSAARAYSGLNGLARVNSNGDLQRCDLHPSWLADHLSRPGAATAGFRPPAHL